MCVSVLEIRPFCCVNKLIGGRGEGENATAVSIRTIVARASTFFIFALKFRISLRLIGSMRIISTSDMPLWALLQDTATIDSELKSRGKSDSKSIGQRVDFRVPYVEPIIILYYSFLWCSSCSLFYLLLGFFATLEYYSVVPTIPLECITYYLIFFSWDVRGCGCQLILNGLGLAAWKEQKIESHHFYSI